MFEYFLFQVIEWLPQSKFILSDNYEKQKSDIAHKNRNQRYSRFSREEKTSYQDLIKDKNKLPLFSTNIQDFAPDLDKLLANYSIKMVSYFSPSGNSDQYRP